MFNLSICCLKSGPQSIKIDFDLYSISIEDLNLLSRLSELKHDSLFTPIVGIPVLVPVPKKVTFIIITKFKIFSMQLSISGICNRTFGNSSFIKLSKTFAFVESADDAKP